MPIDREARPGRGVRIAVIDSGVHASHPHVGRVAGGVAIDAAGQVSDDYVDRIGHGTAVMGAIKEKVPAADCFAVRIFETRLTASASTLIAAIDWAVSARVQVVNLSLGSSNPLHAPAFSAVVARASEAGVSIVAARDDEGVRWLPGCLPGVVQVQVDWGCHRGAFRVGRVDGDIVFRASGFARPIPGVDPRRNLHGVSFAVANMTGLLARALSREPSVSSAEAVELLMRSGDRSEAFAEEATGQGSEEPIGVPVGS